MKNCDHALLMPAIKHQPIKGTRSYAVDISITCLLCGKVFVFLGTPVGLSTSSLRVLMEPSVK